MFTQHSELDSHWRTIERANAQALDDHSTELVGGIKKIEALGALKMLSGGSASLAAVEDLHQATGRDYNLVVGQKHNAIVGSDMQEQILGLRKSVTVGSQHLQAPKTWLGSESVNVLQVMCELLDLIEQMNIQLAEHTHTPGPTPSPVDAGAFSKFELSTAALSKKIKEITL